MTNVRTAVMLTVLVSLVLVVGCGSTHDWRAGRATNYTVGAVLEPQITVDSSKWITGEAEIMKVVGIPLWKITPGIEVADNVSFGAGAPAPADAISKLFDALLGDSMAADARNAAALAAVESEGVDLIVNPHYKIVDNDFIVFRTVHASVRGHGAKITGWKQVPLD